jgi:hypothetical protein
MPRPLVALHLRTIKPPALLAPIVLVVIRVLLLVLQALLVRVVLVVLRVPPLLLALPVVLRVLALVLVLVAQRNRSTRTANITGTVRGNVYAPRLG